MSISGILSSNLSQYQLSAASAVYQQGIQQLSKDLQSGNLSAAQSDFAILQKAFSQPPTTTPSTSDPVARAFNQLASDLKSGNLAAAQKDFSTLQQDLQSLGGPSTHHLHNHYRISTGGLFGGSSSTGSGDSINQDSLLQDFSQLGHDLAFGNLSAAQQAYAALQAQPPVSTGGVLHHTEPPVSAPPVSLVV
jgi:hypothetical protein